MLDVETNTLTVAAADIASDRKRVATALKETRAALAWTIRERDKAIMGLNLDSIDENDRTIAAITRKLDLLHVMDSRVSNAVLDGEPLTSEQRDLLAAAGY